MTQVVPPNRYYLITTSGFPNYGDELIASVWLRYLAATAPDAEVWVDCPSPGPTQLLLGDCHPRVRFVDTLWRLCWHADTEEPWEVVEWVQRAVHDPGHAPWWGAGIELLRTADVVHVVGGGFINTIWPKHIGLLAGAAAAARISGGRSVATGQGFAPVSGDALRALQALAGRFDLMDVRDRRTAELLAGPGSAGTLSRTGDDSFLDLPGAPDYGEERLPRFMLCLQSDLSEPKRGTLAGLALAALRAWGADPADVGVVEGIPRVDREVYSLIEHELPGARFFPFSEVWDRGLPVEASQVWLSTRFHPHLVAAAAGASGVAVSIRADYYATKHSSLLEWGSRWTLVDGLAEDTAVPELPTAGGFTPAAVRERQAAKWEVAEAIYRSPAEPEPEKLAVPSAETPDHADAGEPSGDAPDAPRRGETMARRLRSRLVRTVS